MSKSFCSLEGGELSGGKKAESAIRSPELKLGLSSLIF